MSEFDISHKALANADSDFTASYIIFRQMIEQLQKVDEIAATTSSLRAISQSHLMRKDVLAMTADLQRYLSYKALNESGTWQEMTQGSNAVKFNLSVITREYLP